VHDCPRNRSDGADRVTLAQEVAAGDPAVHFGNNPEDRRVSDEGLDELSRNLNGRKVGGKPMTRGDLSEGLEDDGPACLRISC
jgi:hypothetical protein